MNQYMDAWNSQLFVTHAALQMCHVAANDVAFCHVLV